MEMRPRQVEFKEGSGGTAGDWRFFEMPGSDGNVKRYTCSSCAKRGDS